MRERAIVAKAALQGEKPAKRGSARWVAETPSWWLMKPKRVELKMGR